MPIYEYKCANCGRISSVLTRTYGAPDQLVCSKCGKPDLRRLVSRFAVVRSEESRLEAMADPSAFADVDENDPRSVARWAKRMGREMGEDLGEEFDEMVERMEAGEMPDDLGPDEEAQDQLD